jgi:hypothetical protein
MKQVPTAEEFLSKKYPMQDIVVIRSFAPVLIEFAKLHVEAFREDLLENVKTKEEFFSDENTSLTLIKEMIEDGGYGRYDRYGEVYAVDVISVDKDSILNAYPLTNIK